MKRILSLVFVSVLSIYSPLSFSMTAEETKMIETAAQRGVDGAQVLLATMYRNGDSGYAQDDKLALHWFELAAIQGNTFAQKMLGDIYAEGRGVEKNQKLAADWREKAANRGNVQAQYLLGKMYLNGEGITQDTVKGESWLQRAAQEGSSEAQFLLGKIHYTHKNSAEEQAIAGNLLAKSAAQGYQDAIQLIHFMENLGYDVEENFFKRAPHIRQLAEDGDAEAQYQLAIRYESGATGKKDYPQALHWFNESANQGHLMAMKSLADIYARGLDDMAVDKSLAAQWSAKVRAAETPR
jgi:TPR repeat protein